VLELSLNILCLASHKGPPLAAGAGAAATQLDTEICSSQKVLQSNYHAEWQAGFRYGSQ
jgi:hypothetical protein